MDNQNPAPVQLPPTPLPINPTPVANQPLRPVVNDAMPQAPPTPQAAPQPSISQSQATTPPPQSPGRHFGLKYKIAAGLAGAVILGVGLIAGHAKLTTSTPPVATNNALGSASVSSLKALQAPLEQFYTGHKYYPADITSPTLTSLNIQISQAAQTAPDGTSFQYTASPTGCTTAAKNCTSYTLSAVNNNTGAAAATVHSSAGQL